MCGSRGPPSPRRDAANWRRQRRGGRKAPDDVAYYRPTLDAVWEEFGEDRVIYGSNWPVSARFADYATVQRLVQAYVADQPSSTQRKFFHDNALNVYKWKRS